jgi:hypothetical protein
MLSGSNLNCSGRGNVSCGSNGSLGSDGLARMALPCFGIGPGRSLASLSMAILNVFIISRPSGSFASLVYSRPVNIPCTSGRPNRPGVSLCHMSGRPSIIVCQVIFENSTNIDFIIGVDFNGLLFGFIEGFLDDHSNGNSHGHCQDCDKNVNREFCEFVKLECDCLGLEDYEKGQYQYYGGDTGNIAGRDIFKVFT